ncbi:uncharacterized protein J8A68_003184 [[Candida] subhashii]|uniref:GATA-type domain-containing protein n=1 Tax=[Candida] subhashii TaxID=561895 RepID=A0A8J5QMS4_9ASCO|nr:uncharacterized protein J8A68_003184 [[Candida] subhashii]KAG7663270.1 hypothetical protein J8A68_003184 [[Candida] subhashii]
MSLGEISQRLPPPVQSQGVSTVPTSLPPIKTESTISSTTVSPPPLTKANVGLIGKFTEYQLNQLPPQQLPTPPSKPPQLKSPNPITPATVPTTPAATNVTNNNNSSHGGQPNAKSTTHVNNGTTTTKTNISSPICRNCKTQTTPLWRRDETGQVLCNACGLFLKLHGRPRPISLKTDTIKSRNRVKQSNGATNKASSPNTPELKGKDKGRKSPKPKKNKNNNNNANSGNSDGTGSNLTPLLPATGSNSNVSSPATFKNNNSFHQGINTFHHHHHHHHLPNHLSHLQSAAATGHQVPLHYPSSTPTQFAPGLKRITSPLLLSNSMSSTRIESDTKLTPIQVAAAGALENMSHELGPNATFKPSKGKGARVMEVSLMNQDRNRDHFSSSSSGMSSAGSSIFSSALNTTAPPKLPALGHSNISSPSFGAHTSRSSTPTLPPLHKVGGGDGLPPINSFANYGSGQQNQQQQQSQQQQQQSQQGSQRPDQPNQSNGYQQSNRDNNNNDNNNNNNHNGAHEVTLLKTRISELELVNDLYRTRIMELEAMEQAARLRENSMKKRLDEILALTQQHQQQQQQAQAQQQTQTRAHSSEKAVSTSHHSTPAAAAAVVAPVLPHHTELPSLSKYSLNSSVSPITTSNLTPPTVLPSIGNLTEQTGNIVLPSMKRENDDSELGGGDGNGGGGNGEFKKMRLG